MSSEKPKRSDRQHWLLTGGIAFAAAMIFAFDVTSSQGPAVWVLYLPLCVGVAWFDREREAITAGAIATILIAAGWALAKDGGHAPLGALSRALEVSTIWLALALVLIRQRAARADAVALKSARGAHDQLSGIIINNTEDAIIFIDEDQKITLFNGGAERVFGYRSDEILGQSLTLLLPPTTAKAHARLVQEFSSSPAQSRRMGERTAVAGRRKDGSEFPAEVSISKFAGPDGVVLTAVLRDISDRVKADETLREREQRLRLALSAGQMGTFQIDERTGIARLDTTATRILGLGDEGGNVPPSDRFRNVHPDDKDRLRQVMERARTTGGEVHEQFRVQIEGQPTRWIAAHAYVEHAIDTTPLQTTGIVYDITERKEAQLVLEARVAERTAALRNEIARREEAQSALLRSQKLQAVGELAGGIAHDFNNLLTVITGNLELLGLGQLDAKARDLLRRADEAAKMGGRLAYRLLIIGRRQRLQPVTLDLNELTRSMTDVLRRTLGDQIEVRSEFAADLWPTRADVSEVENALLNLAINARDAMPGGGKLVIQTENKSLGPDDVAGEAGLKPGDYVMLSVTDTGTGIPAENLSRVFEPYFTTKAEGRGTGLGLSTIYGFAKQSGGHLTIYSELGKGTSVRLYLPRDIGSAAAASRPAPMPQQAAGETVLVVEDNPDVRDVTVKRLDMLGYGVLTAENGPAAVALLQGGAKIDLVFSDVVMPGGMSGFDLAKWVRANKPGVKLLLTSGFTGEVAQNGEREIVRDVEVLHKPYAIADLARAVREALTD